MDMVTSIASMATAMKQASLQNAISTKIMDKTLDTQKLQANTLIGDLSQSALPASEIGSSFDVYA